MSAQALDELPGGSLHSWPNEGIHSMESRMLETLNLDQHHRADLGAGPGGPSQMAAGLKEAIKSSSSSLTSFGQKIVNVADVKIGLLHGNSKEEADEPAMEPAVSLSPHREVCKTLEEISWKKLAKSATGCKRDFFAKGVDSIRVKWPGRGGGDDLVKTMQVGLTVLHYTGNKFERRCLKVDEQLRFFYVLGPPDASGKSPRQPSSARGVSPVTVPLPHVKHVFAMDHAMHICEKNGIAAAELQLDSVFAVLVDPRELTGKEKDKDYDAKLDESMPSLDMVQIFVRQSETRLSHFIQAAIDMSQGLDSSTGPHQPARVDTIGLVGDGLLELLDKGAFKIKFEISFKHVKRIRSVAILSDSISSDDLGGITKQLAGELLAVDYSRVVHVIQDAVALRRNILAQHNEIVKRGIVPFVQDWSEIDQPMSPEVNLAEPIEEASSCSRSLEDSSMSSAQRYYEDSGSRAVLECMKYMFEVEKAVQDLNKDTGETDGDIEARAAAEDAKELAPQEPPASVTSTKTPEPLRLSDAKWKCHNCGFINHASNKACQVCGTPSNGAIAPDGATDTAIAPFQMVVAPTPGSTVGAVGTEDIVVDVGTVGAVGTEDTVNANTVGAIPPVNLEAVARQEDAFPSPIPASEREAPPRNYITRVDPRRQERQQGKLVRHAQTDGECVWNSLLAGCVGLEVKGPKTHSAILSFIRSRLRRWSPPAQSPVWWQSCLLSDQEMSECQDAVLTSIHIGDGYCCGACDPLLSAYAFAFSVNIEHSYLDNVFEFEVENPRRCVRLRSSESHMEHVANVELRPNDGQDAHEAAKISTRCSRRHSKTIHETSLPDECGPYKPADNHEICMDDLIEQLNGPQISINALQRPRGQQRRHGQCTTNAALDESERTGKAGAECSTRLERRSAKRALKASLNDRHFRE